MLERHQFYSQSVQVKIDKRVRSIKEAGRAGMFPDYRSRICPLSFNILPEHQSMTLDGIVVKCTFVFFTCLIKYCRFGMYS